MRCQASSLGAFSGVAPHPFRGPEMAVLRDISPLVFPAARWWPAPQNTPFSTAWTPCFGLSGLSSRRRGRRTRFTTVHRLSSTAISSRHRRSPITVRDNGAECAPSRFQSVCHFDRMQIRYSPCYEPKIVVGKVDIVAQHECVILSSRQLLISASWNDAILQP
jgi:hypothetical protein